jgi:hypothetical protein
MAVPPDWIGDSFYIHPGDHSRNREGTTVKLVAPPVKMWFAALAAAPAGTARTTCHPSGADYTMTPTEGARFEP